MTLCRVVRLSSSIMLCSTHIPVPVCAPVHNGLCTSVWSGTLCCVPLVLLHLNLTHKHMDVLYVASIAVSLTVAMCDDIGCHGNSELSGHSTYIILPNVPPTVAQSLPPLEGLTVSRIESVPAMQVHCLMKHFSRWWYWGSHTMVTWGECCRRVFVSPTSSHRHTIVAIVTDN